MARSCRDSWWWSAIGVMASSLVFGSFGCGPGHPRVYPVQGELYWEGKPAAGALVFFQLETSVQVTNETPAKGPRPMGRVQEDGSFKISTYGKDDGAPAGRYRLSIIWTKIKGPGTDEEVDLIPPEFANPETAGLDIVEVKAGKNVLTAIRLPK